MKITHTESTIDMKHYAPMALGNGELSLLVDYKGSSRTRSFCGDQIRTGIWMAGVRYDKPNFPLVPFGYFFDSFEDEEPLNWRQTFDITGARAETECAYRDGSVVATSVLCPFGHRFVLIEKKILNRGTSPAAETFHFAPPRTELRTVDQNRTDYRIDTFEPVSGTIAFFALEGQASFRRDAEDITGEMESGRVVFVLATDQASAEYAAGRTFAELCAEHEADWENFWRESKVPADISERELLVARTAEYHLRISAAPWGGMPIGIYPTHWEGKYFGFDSYFSVMGLIASGHIGLAKNAASFFASHLEGAKKRAYFYCSKSSEAAKYPWQSIEIPQLEGARPGFWLEHIFHMTHIGLICHECAKALRDGTFDRETAYPVMKACAEYHRIFSVCHLGEGRDIIGKCTDLERLGPGRENAFMTTCGVIALFHAAADLAEKLQCDEPERRLWRELAASLTCTLPHDGARYVPYPGCAEPSVALLTGLYPYRVLPPDDPKQLRAFDWFCENERTVGNMYPTGDSLCIWYAGIKTMALLRLGRIEDAGRLIAKMAGATGNFSEVFEIYETCHHPWFTTAEGIYLESLLAYREAEKRRAQTGKRT